MDAHELELYTSRELISELMRRPAFKGIVVHSEDDANRGRPTSPESIFKVHFNSNYDAQDVSRLLDIVAEHMNLFPC